MTSESKSGTGRDVVLHTCPPAFDEKVLLDVYAAGLSEWNRNCRLERHSSPICSMEYVLEGRGRIEVSGASYDLEPGDVFLLHFHEHHAYRTGDCAVWKKVWFAFGHSFVTEAMLHLGLLTESRIRILPKDRPRVEALFREILSLLAEQAPGFRVRSSTSAYELLHLASRSADSSAPRAPVPPSLLRAVRYANDHLGEPLTVELLAGRSFCSRIHLTRLFKRHFGVPTSEWIRSSRMGYAGHLLATTDAPVKTIAAKVGYADPIHFSAAFHRATEDTPSEYRRQHLRDALPSGGDHSSPSTPTR